MVSPLYGYPQMCPSRQERRRRSQTMVMTVNVNERPLRCCCDAIAARKEIPREMRDRYLPQHRPRYLRHRSVCGAVAYHHRRRARRVGRGLQCRSLRKATRGWPLYRCCVVEGSQRMLSGEWAEGIQKRPRRRTEGGYSSCRGVRHERRLLLPLRPMPTRPLPLAAVRR